MSERGLSEKDMGLTEKDTRVGEFDTKKYKSYADLPEDQKPNFVELDGGAFVKKSDAEDRQRFEKRVESFKNMELERKWRREGGQRQEVGIMDALRGEAENLDRRGNRRVEYDFTLDFTRPFTDKYTILKDAEESFEGMTKAKFDARMEEVYEEAHRRDPSVDREKLFRELRGKVLDKANFLLDERLNPWYKGAEEKMTKIGNVMRRAVGESAVGSV